MTAILTTTSGLVDRWGNEQSQLKLTKTSREGQWLDFPNAMYFDYLNYEPQSMDDLHAILAQLETMPDSCLVRGRAINEGPNQRRRIGQEVESVPDGLRWVMLDVDKLPVPRLDSTEEYLDFITGQLPECFHDVTYYFQWSAKAFTKLIDGYPETLSVHLFYWLEAPRSCENLKSRIREESGDWHGSPLDHAVFSPAQIHYTAPPIFLDDRGRRTADPLGDSRSGVMLGTKDAADVQPWIPPFKNPMAIVAAQAQCFADTGSYCVSLSLPEQLERIGKDGHIHSPTRAIVLNYIRTTPRFFRNREKFIGDLFAAVEKALEHRPEEAKVYSRRYIENMYTYTENKFTN